MRSALVITGIIAAALAGAVIFGVLTLPRETAVLLERVPAKFVLVEIGLALVVIAALLIYWSLRTPTLGQATLGFLRICTVIALSSVAAPTILLGIESLSLSVGEQFNLRISWADTVKFTTATVLVALSLAYLALRAFREIRLLEIQQGLPRNTI